MNIFFPRRAQRPVCPYSLLKGADAMLSGILWAVVVVLVILWLLGFVVLHVSSFAIHILLIVALIVLLYNLFVGMRRRV
jgi:Family of unknown function (DUF5670)